MEARTNAVQSAYFHSFSAIHVTALTIYTTITHHIHTSITILTLSPPPLRLPPSDPGYHLAAVEGDNGEAETEEMCTACSNIKRAWLGPLLVGGIVLVVGGVAYLFRHRVTEVYEANRERFEVISQIISGHALLHPRPLFTPSFIF